MQFMLIRTDNDDSAATADPQAVLDDLLRRLPAAHPADSPSALAGHGAAAGTAVEGMPRAPALALAFAPDAQALRLRLWPGGEAVTAGPFPSAERLPAGFAVFEAPSRAAALAWLQDRGLAPAGGAVTLELRETGCPGGCAGIPPGAAGDDACYAILLRSDAGTERDAIPLQDKLDRLNAFNAIHAAAGTLLAGDGLKSTARGARVRVANGGASVIDGPFAEAKELIAGFWMIRAPSIEAALDWARTLPYPTGPEVEVEIRPVALFNPLGASTAADASDRLREDASVRAEQLDAALRAELAPQPAWDRP
jgi:hypothetical protein